MAVTSTKAGIKNRNLAVGETFYYRYFTFYVKISSPLAAGIPTGHKIRFTEPDEAMELVGFQASVDSVAGAITTLTVDIQNSTTQLINGVINLKGKSQQIVQATLGATTRIPKGDTVTITVANSNNESAYDLTILVKCRPLVGLETRA